MNTRILPARSVLAVAAAVVLAACGDDSADDSGTATAQAAQPAGESPAPDALRPAGGSTGSPSAVAEAKAANPRAPALLRGIYLNAYAAGSTNRLRKLIAIADSTEINAFVIDVKDEKGIRYRSDIPLANQLAQPGEVTIRNLAALADTLGAHGIWSIARIVVFKDPILSKAKPDWSIRNPSGGLWVDKAGNTWVSAWEPAVWDYNIQIAEEVTRRGFDEVQFDYVRFPEPYPSLPTQVHPKAKGERTDAIRTFLIEAKRRLQPLGAVVAADVFGLSPNEGSDVRIGQQWEMLVSVADHILPMVYASHYLPTHLRGVPRPNQMPYETVFASVGMAAMRNAKLQQAGVRPARIIPWIQAFDAPWIDKTSYGVDAAQKQISAVHATGLEDWIFWHPGSKYEHIAGAFAADLQPRAKTFAPNPDMVSSVQLFEKQGAQAARARVAAEAKASRPGAP